jgi:hypothetical protein
MVDERAGMVILMASAFKAVADGPCLPKTASADGRAMSCDGDWATNAETVEGLLLPFHERRQRRAVVLEMPAMNFIAVQSRLCVLTLIDALVV